MGAYIGDVLAVLGVVLVLIKEQHEFVPIQHKSIDHLLVEHPHQFVDPVLHVEP